MRHAFSIYAVECLAVSAGATLLLAGTGLLGLGFAAIAGLNVGTFLLFGLDKAIAAYGPPRGATDGRRVPESLLLTFAALGAAPGAWLAMLVFRHKTRKVRFQAGIPILLLLEIGVGWLAFVAWPEIVPFLSR